MKKKLKGKDLCDFRGWHDYESRIDPKTGGFLQCKDCGKQRDCEDPDGDSE